MSQIWLREMSKMIKIVFPNGQHMGLDLSKVSRVYIDDATLVFVTGELTNMSRFSAANKTINKKVYVSLRDEKLAHKMLDDILDKMD